MNKKRGQVWIETVVYTLIAFVMIAAVLAVAKPRIEEMQDKATITQSIEMMKEIDGIISNVVQGGPGNKQIIEIGIKKGSLIVNSLGDELRFEMESRYKYSELVSDEPQAENDIGAGIKYRTEAFTGKTYRVIFTKDYDNYDLQFGGDSEAAEKEIGTTTTIHKISFLNKGNVEVGTGVSCSDSSTCTSYPEGYDSTTAKAKCVDSSCVYLSNKISIDVGFA